MRYARGCTRERKTWRISSKKKDKERKGGRERQRGIGNRRDKEREGERDTEKAVALDH